MLLLGTSVWAQLRACEEVDAKQAVLRDHPGNEGIVLFESLCQGGSRNAVQDKRGVWPRRVLSSPTPRAVAACCPRLRPSDRIKVGALCVRERVAECRAS